MINTILVEDDLYIQKHFAERLKSNETAIAQYSLFLWMYKHSTSTPVLPPQNV